MTIASRVGFVSIIVLPIVAIVWMFVSAFKAVDESDRRAQELWAGAQVVKICRSGTYIFKLRDGSYLTGGWANMKVSSPEVCQ